mmetsp:Transcript_47764/g.142679  ORF Transcript_47764/g.142679 Transcript_47764/m.142679 type:complete len:201 (+) Transcript_47764:103-705(+)
MSRRGSRATCWPWPSMTAPTWAWPSSQAGGGACCWCQWTPMTRRHGCGPPRPRPGPPAPSRRTGATRGSSPGRWTPRCWTSAPRSPCPPGKCLVRLHRRCRTRRRRPTPRPTSGSRAGPRARPRACWSPTGRSTTGARSRTGRTASPRGAPCSSPPLPPSTPPSGTSLPPGQPGPWWRWPRACCSSRTWPGSSSSWRSRT